MTKRTRHLAVALALAGAALSCSRPASDPRAASPSPSPSPLAGYARPLPSPLPEIVARVNGRPVHLWQVVPLVRSELVRFAPEQQESRRADALRKALDKYIDRELLLEEALTRGLGTDTRAVERSYDEARRDYPRDEDWVAFLKAEGLDPERFRGEIRSQHLVAALLADELRKHPVTEDEMLTAYNLSPEAFWERARVRETFETARGRVKQALERQRLQIIQRALVEELRARARIEILV